MPRPFPPGTSETTVLTPWQDLLATAASTPWRVREPVPGGGELWRRMTAWYAQLRALPRRMRRMLQRQLALPLVGVALLLALGPGPSQAATIVVDGVTCTLVDAITAANTDTAQGGCPAGSGTDTLVLEPPGSTVTLTHVDNTSYGPTGLPVIRSVMTITGQGSTITRAPNAPEFRLLAVKGSGDLTLQEVTLTGGVVHRRNYYYREDRGGGVFNYNGTVTIEGSTISGNTGGGVANFAYYGSATLTIIHSTISGNSGFGVDNESYGIFNAADLTILQSLIANNGGPGVGNCSCYEYSSTTLTLTQSTIAGNSGGGVANFGSGPNSVMISDSTIAGNTSGGLANSGGSVMLTQSTISGNTASDGGGVSNLDGAVTLTDSTISDNTATGRGGGVVNSLGRVTLTNSTISGNTAATGGGVVNEGSLQYNYDGPYRGYGILTLTQSTISDNSATGRGGGVVNRADAYGGATLTLTQSTIAGNTAAAGGGIVNTGDGDDSRVMATLLQSTIAGNTATSRGGGVVNYLGRVTLTQSTISGNTATDGGGVVNEGSLHYKHDGCFYCARVRYRGYGILTLTQSTIAGNTATGRGGGVVNRADYYGGATLTLTQSTISGNRASTGGGLVNTAGGDDSRVTATLLQSTITGNTATDGGGVVTSAAYEVSHVTVTVTLAGSLVAGNVAPTAPEILRSAGTLTANAFNLFGVSGSAGVSGFTPGPIDVVPSAPLTAILDPVLADHGGPTLTHALVPGSPAIDAIPWGTNGCGTTSFSDQRWQARPQAVGGRCDIGAYEVEVAGQALGAWVSGLTPETVTCKNVTTGQAVTLSDPATSWDCEAAGVGVSSGDQVALRVQGPVNKDATDVGGAVVGMAPRSGGCTNLTTGQSVKFQHMVGATAGSCVAAGLVVHPGESVQMSVQGGAE
jgi:Right handed beta helix region